MNENNSRENDVRTILEKQEEINSLIREQLKFNTDFLYVLLDERQKMQQHYLKAITKLVAFIIIPLVIMISIFFMGYFFSDYEDYDNNSETYTSSNIIKNAELDNNSNITINDEMK